MYFRIILVYLGIFILSLSPAFGGGLDYPTLKAYDMASIQSVREFWLDAGWIIYPGDKVEGELICNSAAKAAGYDEDKVNYVDWFFNPIFKRIEPKCTSENIPLTVEKSGKYICAMLGKDVFSVDGTKVLCLTKEGGISA